MAWLLIFIVNYIVVITRLLPANKCQNHGESQFLWSIIWKRLLVFIVNFSNFL